MEERELQSPLPSLVGDARGEAIRHLFEYMTSYTGRFLARFAERSDEDRFEADEIVAVSYLGVDVPEAVSGWLLLCEGQERSGMLLAQLGSRSVELSPDLVDAAEEVRAGAEAMGADVTHLSILRIIDIVLWRSEEVRRRGRVG